MNTFGDNLKNFRKLSGISQTKFAELHSATQQRVSEWERNKVEPSLYNVIRILSVLNITFEELAEGLS